MFSKLLEQAGVDLERGRDEEEIEVAPVNIVVIGVGGAGNNSITKLYEMNVSSAKLVAVNTDLQHLKKTKAHRKILIGENVTRGQGAGGDPRYAFLAAEESANDLEDVLRDADLIFIIAGMGGGTGTGASPFIARLAKDIAKRNNRAREPLVVAVVTYPFQYEGNVKLQKAESGIKALLQYADTVIVIDNNKLLEYVPDLPIQEAFKVIDELIAQMIKSLSDTIARPSLVNIDFADVYTVMKKGGLAVIGFAESNSNNNRAIDAVMSALNNKLLDVEYQGGKAALIHFTIGPDVTIQEINQAMAKVMEHLSDNSEIIWGARIDDNLKGYVRAMIIMTGVRSKFINPSEVEKLRAEVDTLEGYSKRGEYTPRAMTSAEKMLLRDFYTTQKDPLVPPFLEDIDEL
ncbi:cell division protein FtsZ [Pyrococcus kukulkanii]|uniref:cell division protein FtsZ n=1 Tax=Pyrococcus kukulkanii TaxID=1609559 RepID=UPI0035638EE0